MLEKIITNSLKELTPNWLQELTPNFFQELEPDKKLNLYRRLELEKGLVVNTIRSEDENWLIAKAFKKAIYWNYSYPDTTKPITRLSEDISDKPNGEPNWIVPRKNGSLTVNVSSSSLARELVKFFSEGTNTQTLSLFGLDSNSNSEYSQSKISYCSTIICRLLNSVVQRNFEVDKGPRSD